MNPLEIRDDLRAFLNSDEVNLSDIARKTPLSLSWLSKFRRGELNNPTVEALETLRVYRESKAAA